MGNTIHTTYKSMLINDKNPIDKYVKFINKIQKKGKINKVDNYGNTLLMITVKYATGNKLYDLIKKLLENGANPNISLTTLNIKNSIDKEYCSINPLELLCRKQPELYYEVIKLLLDTGMFIPFNLVDLCYYKYHISDSKNPYNIDLSVVDLLIDYNINMGISNIYYISGLMLISAIKNCDINRKTKLLEKMIKKGANQKIRDPDGKIYLDYLTYNLKKIFTPYYKNSFIKKNENIFVSKICVVCYNGEEEGDNLELCLTNCNHAILCPICLERMLIKVCPHCDCDIISYKKIKIIN